MTRKRVRPAGGSITQAPRCVKCGRQELDKIHNMFSTMSESGGGKGHMFIPPLGQ